MNSWGHATNPEEDVRVKGLLFYRELKNISRKLMKNGGTKERLDDRNAKSLGSKFLTILLCHEPSRYMYTLRHFHKISYIYHSSINPLTKMLGCTLSR